MAIFFCNNQTIKRFNFLAVFPFSLLRGAEEMGLRKAVKPEFGGGTRSFSCEEDYIYENIESELCFFTSQVSQPFSFLSLSLRKHTDTRTQINFPPSSSSPSFATGEAEHHKILDGQSKGQTRGGASQYQLPGRPANQ